MLLDPSTTQRGNVLALTEISGKRYLHQAIPLILRGKLTSVDREAVSDNLMCSITRIERKLKA